MRPTPSRLRDSKDGGRCRRAGQPAHAPYSFPTARQLRRMALPKGEAAHPRALPLPGRATAEAVGSTEERGKSPMHLHLPDRATAEAVGITERQGSPPVRPTPSRPRDS